MSAPRAILYGGGGLEAEGGANQAVEALADEAGHYLVAAAEQVFEVGEEG